MLCGETTYARAFSIIIVTITLFGKKGTFTSKFSLGIVSVILFQLI